LGKVEDCRIEWRIVGKSGGLLVNVEDCWIEWRIVGKSGGLLVNVEECTLEARSAGGPLVHIYTTDIMLLCHALTRI
jgi:hypothetical protein